MRNSIMSNKEFGVPFQLQQIIDNMLNTKDNVYLRVNYKNRLEVIKTELEKALSKFNKELNAADNSLKDKKRA